MMSLPIFELPDLMASMPELPFEFSPGAEATARATLSEGPEAVFRSLIRDQESEAGLLVARKIIGAFLQEAAGDEAGDAALMGGESADADAIAARVLSVRDELATAMKAVRQYEPDVFETVLRQRAPVGLVGGCWLDTISQPATQPSVIVNHLVRHHFILKGEGNRLRSSYYVLRRALEDAEVYLPEIDAEEFLAEARTRPLTAAHASFYVALSRLPASFLPEVVGVHYAFLALGVDGLLAGTPEPLSEPMLRASLAQYLDLTRPSPNGVAERRRLLAAIRLVLKLEREHVDMLAELAAWRGELPLDARVAEIVMRHAPFAGPMHRDVRLGRRSLTDTFDDPGFDLAAFITEFRGSRHLKPGPTGGCRFLDAIKFGGSMFAVFDEREARTLRAWVAEVQAGNLPEVVIPVNRVGDATAARRHEAVIGYEPDDVVYAEPPTLDDRELLYRLVNIERFPNTLELARRRAEESFDAGEILFTCGAGGKYTDASYFPYTPEALRARVDSIYWDKLINPYRPLEEIPDRENVIFHQMTMALGNLIEAAWSHRIANLGRFKRRSDDLLFAIYADEMGRGELEKNHVTLIHRVMDSLSIRLPHVRDAAFRDQEILPDHPYDFTIRQMCMSLFPDSFYSEILGYNLAIEMYGLGELRMHEIEKLRAHGFDIAYEEAHLSIDNVSAGHSRQSVDAIISYLDEVERGHGAAFVQEEWRRVWRGYAAFAFYPEHRLISTQPASAASASAAAPPAEAVSPADSGNVDLVI
ncbi:hypothetical protein GCM10022226_30780 [Sphaerisporangium flaviroseum]|uniref:Iron-containing redox enzyme family protein n=1 Tax=Sphaerisporangium flaviroseum TaxID=509199 RepID=A0ABP7I3A4_9ACTN